MKANISRRAFSLVELLVVITLIVMLITMMGTAINSARASSKAQKTKAAISVLNDILQRHFSSCESTPLVAADYFAGGDPDNTPAKRLDAAAADPGVAIRQKITADMPDSWAEVRYLKSIGNANPPKPYYGPRQRGYVAMLDAVNPSDSNASSECLFMIITQGALADCLTCSSLESIVRGDTDSDGALEFLDAWGEPIQYVLWPAGFELPIDERFFEQVPPFSGRVGTGEPGGLMRPLIISGGPDTRTVTAVNKNSNLELLGYCGNPKPDASSGVPWVDALNDSTRMKLVMGAGGQLLDSSGSPTADSTKPWTSRADNITSYYDRMNKK